MNEFTLALLKVDTLCIESPVRYFDSFIAIETYICMYKQITAYKRQAPSPAWALLGTLWYLRHWHYLWENCTLLDFGLNLVKTQNNLLDKCFI